MYATGGEYILFQCGHLFHKSCLQYNNSNKSTTMTNVSSSTSVPTFANLMGINHEDMGNIRPQLNEVGYKLIIYYQLFLMNLLPRKNYALFVKQKRKNRPQ